jgi:hypothetical protein
MKGFSKLLIFIIVFAIIESCSIVMNDEDQFLESFFGQMVLYASLYAILFGFFSMIYYIYIRRKFTKNEVNTIFELANPEGIGFLIAIVFLFFKLIESIVG